MDAHTGIDPTHSNYKRSAAVCIFHKDTVCLGLRCLKNDKGEDYPYAGYWSAFGGAVEDDENPMVGACRELKEETKIDLAISDLSYIQEISNEDGKYILYAHHTHELIFPILNFEHTEYGYFRIDSLDSSPSPICPMVVRAIKSYDSRRWKP